jgi:hypothetical protein
MRRLLLFGLRSGCLSVLISLVLLRRFGFPRYLIGLFDLACIGLAQSALTSTGAPPRSLDLTSFFPDNAPSTVGGASRGFDRGAEENL